MNWFLYELPPVSMPRNGMPGNGFSDEVLKQVALRWPQAQHQYFVGNPARVWAELELGKPLCATTLRSPEHARFTYFTPIYLVPPLLLITRHDLVKRLPLNDRGEVRLQALLKKKWKGLLIKSRTYGLALDSRLAKSPADAQVEWISTNEVVTGIPKMIARRRADWTIEFDFVLAYQRKLDPGLSEIVALPIENASRPLEGGISCPKTPWGLAAIQRIAKIVSDPAIARLARTETTRWQTDESRHHYASDVEKFYRKWNHPGYVNPYE